MVIVIRDISGFSVGPTVRLSILKPRARNMLVTRNSTPGLFSTRALMRCIPARLPHSSREHHVLEGRARYNHGENIFFWRDWDIYDCDYVAVEAQTYRLL